MAAAAAAATLWLELPFARSDRPPVPIFRVLRVPAVGACALAVVVAAATISMWEPVLALHLQSLGVNPARIGIVFGVAAVATAALHPIYGRLADRWGARRLTLIGLALSGAVMPLGGRVVSFESAIPIFVVQAAAVALMIAPSLAYMAEATSAAGLESFGVAYGLYNVAWGFGLLSGPAAGGFLFERIGVARLTLWWSLAVIVATLLLTRVKSNPADAGRKRDGRLSADPEGR
jgi:MFS family permease